MHRDYLKEHRPVLFNQLVLSGSLWTYLADTNEQAQQRLEVIIRQMMIAEGVTEKLKETKQMEWIQRATTIQILAKDIILNEMIFA